MIRAYYFGCIRERGHFLYEEGERRHYGRVPDDFPLQEHVLDGALLPPGARQIEGNAVFIHLSGWTVIQFWDRSLDSRSNSSSTFLLRGKFTFEQAMHECKTAFPNVWKRYSFEVREAKP